MKTWLWAFGVILMVALPACSPAVSTVPPVPFPAQVTRSLTVEIPVDATLTMQDPPTITPPPSTPVISEITPTSSTPTPAPALTLTPLPDCPRRNGYTWSNIYIGDAPASIAQIILMEEGSYLLRGQVAGYAGAWIAKMDARGGLIWQNIYGNEPGNLRLAPDGNLILEFSRANLEISPDGGVVRGLTVPWYHPNADGSFTVMSGSQVARYRDPQTPLWQVAIKNLGALGMPTGDGGAIFAYAGSYVDQSVYWAPIYTDIKVIKIDGDGQVWEKTYGTLVGDETLDFLQATDDGGALLAGMHAYQEQGADFDIWLLKLNARGSFLWQTTLLLPLQAETLENLYVLAGGYVAQVSVNDGEDLIVVNLNLDGSLRWQKIISSIRGPVSITALAGTPDGGLLLAGKTNEITSVTWLARLDAKGSMLWEKIYGVSGIPGLPETHIGSLLSLNNGEFLLAGFTEIVGTSISPISSAWVAQVEDSGQPGGFLILKPGKFRFASTIGDRPNTLPDEILPNNDLPLVESIFLPLETKFRSIPACLGAGAQIPSPAALPTLTPSASPFPVLTRDLHLAIPPMQGDDVLKLQRRLQELGYRETGIPDGIFGNKTDTAVRNFQFDNGLAVDGVVGPKTWKQLFSDESVSAGRSG